VSHRDELFRGFIPTSDAIPQGKFANAGRIRQHARRVRYPTRVAALRIGYTTS
jgi:hypothetical protein